MEAIRFRGKEIRRGRGCNVIFGKMSHPYCPHCPYCHFRAVLVQSPSCLGNLRDTLFLVCFFDYLLGFDAARDISCLAINLFWKNGEKWYDREKYFDSMREKKRHTARRRAYIRADGRSLSTVACLFSWLHQSLLLVFFISS